MGIVGTGAVVDGIVGRDEVVVLAGVVVVVALGIAALVAETERTLDGGVIDAGALDIDVHVLAQARGVEVYGHLGGTAAQPSTQRHAGSGNADRLELGCRLGGVGL